MSLLEAVQSARGETPSQTTPTSQGGTSLLNAVQISRGEVTPTSISQPKKKKSLTEKAKPIFEAGKKLISQLTGYVKATKQRPFETAAGAGTKIIQFFGGDLAGTIQQGIASITGKDIPDRWNLKKQAKAFEELNRMNLGAEGKENVNAQAFETGKFLGSFVPYYFAGAVAGASVGTRILAPVASKFVPKAVKLVPVISNAIGFTGVGQLEYDKEVDGARVDRLKTDLVMLALFEVGGALAKGLAKGTSKLVSKTVTGISKKIKSGEQVPIAEIEKAIAETKGAIAKDTGKSAEVVLANNIAGASEKEIQALTPKVEVPKGKGVPKVSEVALGEKPPLKPITEAPKAEKIAVPTEKPQISAKTPLPSPIKKVSPPQAQKVVSPTEKFQSRVFQRLKADHPQLEGELTYDPIKLKEQAKKAVDLIAKDKQKAFDVAMGKEPSKEVTSTAVNIAMSEKALDEGNHELYAKLIKTRSLEQTRRGQELVSEKGSLDDNSTSRYVKELISTRLENVGKKYLSGLKEGAISNKEHAMKVVSRKAEVLEKKILNKKLDVRTALTLLDELACI